MSDGTRSRPIDSKALNSSNVLICFSAIFERTSYMSFIRVASIILQEVLNGEVISHEPLLTGETYESPALSIASAASSSAGIKKEGRNLSLYFAHAESFRKAFFIVYSIFIFNLSQPSKTPLPSRTESGERASAWLEPSVTI